MHATLERALAAMLHPYSLEPIAAIAHIERAPRSAAMLCDGKLHVCVQVISTLKVTEVFKPPEPMALHLVPKGDAHD